MLQCSTFFVHAKFHSCGAGACAPAGARTCACRTMHARSAPGSSCPGSAGTHTTPTRAVISCAHPMHAVCAQCSMPRRIACARTCVNAAAALAAGPIEHKSAVCKRQLGHTGASLERDPPAARACSHARLCCGRLALAPPRALMALHPPPVFTVTHISCQTCRPAAAAVQRMARLCTC